MSNPLESQVEFAENPEPPVVRPRRPAFAGFAAFAAVAFAIVWGVVGHTQHVPAPVAATAPAPAITFVPSSKSKINPKDGAEMIQIPAGPFQMGDTDQSDNPVHTVTLSSYYIYKNDVTVAMYKKFCAATGHAMPPAPDWGWDKSNYPIVNVTWNDATAYCKWAGVHLPTEAQWEKAARGTDGRQYPWGNDWDPAKCANSVGTSITSPTPVGSFPAGASPYGAMDMAGNVWNWCSDWYDADYCKGDHGADPTGPDSGDTRVLRGGSWSYNPFADIFRASFRNNVTPTFDNNLLGLRGASGP
ncbi:MAG: formylglycine-generating enzyme family protein [Capsulimonadaceae bacterium]